MRESFQPSNIISLYVLFAEVTDNNYHQHFGPADYMGVGGTGERILRLGLVMILTFISRSYRDRLWGSQDFHLADHMGVEGMGGVTGFGMNVDELFNIANMAKKYQIDALKESVKKALEAYPLDENNVVICASHAREYHQFEELSQALLLHCTKFLKSVVVKAEDYEVFAAKYWDSNLGETAIKSLGMMAKDAPLHRAERSEENKAKRER